MNEREKAIQRIAYVLELLGSADAAKAFQRRADTTPNVTGVVQIARQYLEVRPLEHEAPHL